MSRLLAAALAILACAPAASAQTAPPDAVRLTARIRYSAPDVRDRAGALALMNRIARAAGAVCADRPEALVDEDRDRFERCRLEAYGRAVTRLDPQVIAAVADGPAANPSVTAH